MAEEEKKGFLLRNWKVIAVIGIIVIVLILFIMVGTKSQVSPDVAYFPT